MAEKMRGNATNYFDTISKDIFHAAGINGAHDIEIEITDGQIIIRKMRTKSQIAKAILDIFYDGDNLPSYTFSTTPDRKYRLCVVTGIDIGIGMAEITDTCENNSYFFQAIAWYEAMQDYCWKCGEHIPALDLLKDDFEFLKS